MKLIPLSKLETATLAERQHGVIVVREQPDGGYGVLIGKRCLKILRELEQSGLLPTDIPVRCVVLSDDGEES
jgi:hypothetical protein